MSSTAGCFRWAQGWCAGQVGRIIRLCASHTAAAAAALPAVAVGAGLRPPRHSPLVLKASNITGRAPFMLQGVVQFAPAFTWEPSVGGRAFNYTIASLRRCVCAFAASCRS